MVCAYCTVSRVVCGNALEQMVLLKFQGSLLITPNQARLGLTPAVFGTCAARQSEGGEAWRKLNKQSATSWVA